MKMKRQLIVEYALQHMHENLYFSRDKNNFLKLIDLITKHKSGFARSLLTQNKKLLDWINECLPALQDEKYQISTKCYWILKGLTNFPKCKKCGKPFIGKNVKINFGYRTYCSTLCEINDNKVLQKGLKNRWKKFHRQNVAFTKHEYEKRNYKQLIYQILSHMSHYDQIKWLVENRTDSCVKIISSKKFKNLKSFIISKTRFLDKFHVTISVRIFCILENIVKISDARLRCKTCNKLLVDKPCSLNNGFQDYCSLKCQAKNANIINKKRKTHFKNYGCYNEAIETKIKRRNSNIKKYGTPSWSTRICDYNSLTNEQKENRRKVWNNHIYVMEKKGIKNYGFSRKCDANATAMFSFNTFNYGATQQFKRSTKAENRCFFMLLMLYPHLIRQFKSKYYPFNCDFYDPISGIYIEFNGTWSHGQHFFDPSNENDIKIALKWKNSTHTTYQSAYKTWTQYDVKKRRCAIENNLNYIVFWTEDEVRRYVLDELQKIASKM